MTVLRFLGSNNLRASAPVAASVAALRWAAATAAERHAKLVVVHAWCVVPVAASDGADLLVVGSRGSGGFDRTDPSKPAGTFTPNPDAKRQRLRDTDRMTTSGAATNGSCPGVSPRVTALLAAEREGVLDRALSGIRHVRAPHYEAAGAEEIRWRLEALYDDVAVAATRRNLGPLVEHAQRLAEERYARGYSLAELQAAFNALEEALWEQLLTDVPSDDLADALTLLSSIFGVAKDTLACAYVEAITLHRHPALDLESLVAGAGSA